MSKLQLNERITGVPDKYRYTFPETGHTIRNFSHSGLIDQIKKYAQDNGFPVPSVEDVEDQLCKLLPPGWCHYEDGGEPSRFINTRFNVEDFVHGTTVGFSFWISHDDVVSQELAESRAATCAACFANVHIPGCSACYQLANLVTHYIGARTTKADQFLRACAVCKCSNQAQVWIPIEHLAKGVTPDMMELYKTVPHCWKRLEIEALQNEQHSNGNPQFSQEAGQESQGAGS